MARSYKKNLDEMREEEKEKARKRREFQDIKPEDAKDQFGPSLSDEETKELKEKMDKAVSPMAKADEPKPDAKSDEDEVKDDNVKVDDTKDDAKADDAKADSKDDIKPDPDVEPDKPKLRPKQDPEPKPMTGCQTVMPGKADGFTPEPPGWFKNEPLDPEVERFVQEEIEAGRLLDFDNFVAESEARRSYAMYKTRYAEYVRKLHFEAEEAKKWKTVLLVDGGKTFIKDALMEEFATIDVHRRWSDERKLAAKRESAVDLIGEAVAYQRHCETEKVRQFETPEEAEKAKNECRDELWDLVEELTNPKKTHSAGSSTK